MRRLLKAPVSVLVLTFFFCMGIVATVQMSLTATGSINPAFECDGPVYRTATVAKGASFRPQ